MITIGLVSGRNVSGNLQTTLTDATEVTENFGKTKVQVQLVSQEFYHRRHTNLSNTSAVRKQPQIMHAV